MRYGAANLITAGTETKCGRFVLLSLHPVKVAAAETLAVNVATGFPEWQPNPSGG
jgi:hypothetical protein